MTELEIRSLRSLNVPGFDRLRKAATAEGFRFIERLVDQWDSGENRFDRPGEGLWGAFWQEQLVGTAGLSRLLESMGQGRVRRLYVVPELRGRGMGRALIGELVNGARPWAERLLLFTENPAAAQFYCRLDFVPTDRIPNVSHVLELG